MKNLLNKIWTAMCSVPQRNLWCAILGMFLCTLIGICLPTLAEWPIFPLILLAVIVFFIATLNDVKKDVWPLVWYAAGVLVPQIMFWVR
jgi:hypothetical protein